MSHSDNLDLNIDGSGRNRHPLNMEVWELVGGSSKPITGD